MTTEGMYQTFTAVASQDLTGHMHKAVGLDGLVSATALATRGLLKNKALNGDHITLGYQGIMKAIAGAAINSGAQVSVTTSGFLITVTTSNYIGIALESAGSGSLFRGMFDFDGGQIG
jgi:hypothetical protein